MFRVFLVLFAFLIAIPKYSVAQKEIEIKLGVDVLVETDFEIVKGKRVGLLTNHAGRDKYGNLTAEILSTTDSCELTAIFVPEHGFYTTIPAGEHVDNDSLFGVPMYSLYGKNKKPGQALLDKCDIVLVDLQDIGVRSYTYLSTLYNMTDACAEHGKPLVVLDRPNPLGGMIIDGGTVDEELDSFVGKVPVAYVHGCTFGEIAKMINAEGWLSRAKNGKPRHCDLTVLEMHNWQRWMNWEDTGLMWFPTSPHIPTVNAVRGAAMLGVLGELGIISIGIGTTSPFQYLGKPGFNMDMFKETLGTLSFNGIKLIPSKYRPFYGMYSSKNCGGYLLKFTMDNLFAPYSTGLKIMLALRKSHPELFELGNMKSSGIDMFRKVTGSKRLIKLIINGKSERAVLTESREGLDEFLEIRSKYLIY